MYRRTTTAALLLACIAAACATSSVQARKNRSGRVLADLYCRTEYDDAQREISQLRGPERDAAEDAIRKRYIDCRRRSKRAYQVEDVMPRLFPR